MRALALLLVLLVACDTRPPARAPSVPIVVDGEVAATVDPGQASSVVPLAAAAPDHRWTALVVTRPDGGTERVEAAQHPGLVPALYLERGRIALGFFRPADIGRREPPRARIGVVAQVTLE